MLYDFSAICLVVPERSEHLQSVRLPERVHGKSFIRYIYIFNDELVKISNVEISTSIIPDVFRLKFEIPCACAMYFK